MESDDRHAGSESIMPKIMEIWAYIVADTGPEDEGIVAMKRNGVWLPMVGADKERVESLRPYAEETASITGQKITLAKFTQRTDLKTITPSSNNGVR